MKKSLLVIAAAIGLVVLASVAIWKTSGDDSRRQGALQDDPPTLSWHGDWNAETEYARGNVVSYEGISYVATGEKLAEAPQPCTGECAGWTTMSTAKAPAVETETPAEAVNNITGYELVKRDVEIAPGTTKFIAVLCPAGKKIISAGWEQTPPVPGSPFWVDGGSPRTDFVGGASGWAYTGSVFPAASGNVNFRAHGICAHAA